LLFDQVSLKEVKELLQEISLSNRKCWRE